MRRAGGGGQGTQSACEVLWPNRMGFLNLYLSFPRVRGCGERGGSRGGGVRVRGGIEEPEEEHVVLVWGAACRDVGSGFPLFLLRRTSTM